MGVVTIAIVGVVLLASDLCAATEVLVMTGDGAADGARLDSISAPAAGGDTAIFLGGTSAVLTASGGASTVVAKTGDPLPAPFDGTFNRISNRVAINDDGVVAFAATLNSRLVTDGIFLVEHGRVVTVTNGATPVIGDVLDVNRQGDLLYIGGRTDLWLWTHSTGSAVRLVARDSPAPGGGSFRLFGRRPVLGDGGLVAFVATVNRLPGRPRTNEAFGVFTVDAARQVTAVLPPQGTDRAVARRFLRRTVAINAAGAVAYTAVVGSVDGAFLFRREQPLRRVARVGDSVGTKRLERIDPEFMGVDSSGRVAFEGVFDDGRRIVIGTGDSLAAVTEPLLGLADFGPRLTDSGRIAWLRDGRVEILDGESVRSVVAPDATPLGPGVTVASPRVNDGGAVAFAARQDGLYAWSRGSIAPVARVGETIGGMAIASLERPHVVRGDTIAFFASDAVAGEPLLAVRRGGAAPVRVVAHGGGTPIGGTFDELESLDVRGGHVFFVSSVNGGTAEEALFEADVARQTVRALVKRGDAVRGQGRIASFGPVAVTRRGPAFFAGIDTGAAGLFLLRRGTPVPAVVTGDPVRGTGHPTLGAVGPFVTRGDAFLLGGALSGVGGPGGIFVSRARRTSKVFLDGEVVSGSGAVTDSFPIAFGARGAMFLGSFTADNDQRLGVFQRGRRATRRLVAVGDALLGGVITDMGPPTGSDGRAILAAGLGAGAPARTALLRVGK